MLTLIRTLGPIAALVLGLAGGGSLIGGLGWAYTSFIHDPQLVREATNRANDVCTIRVMDAANRATAAERDRQQAAINAAEQAYRDATDARERLAQSVQDQFEQEITDYEKRLAENGRACTLDGDDLEFLRSKQPATAKRP